jgi:hypothetical protein
LKRKEKERKKVRTGGKAVRDASFFFFFLKAELVAVRIEES